MSEDLTKKLPASDSEKLTLILTTVQALTGRVDNIDSRLGNVEQTLDDTRPMWQRVFADIGQLQEGQRQLQEGQRALGADILQLQEGHRALSTEVRALRRDLDSRFNILYDKLAHTEIYHCDIHDRVTRLELSHNPPNSQT